jgi:methyl-accepting chemotaxis protein
MAAREQAMDILRHTRYSGQGYFYAYDSAGTQLLYADKLEGIGKNFADVRDAKGVYVIKGLVQAAKAGNHYLEYAWEVPNSCIPVPKLGYVDYLQKWDLTWGTSVNLDDIDREVQAVAEATRGRIRTLMLSLLGIAVVLLASIAGAGVMLGGTIVRPLLRIKANLDDIAAGDGNLTHRLPAGGDDELGELAGSFNRFVEKIHAMVGQT